MVFWEKFSLQIIFGRDSFSDFLVETFLQTFFGRDLYSGFLGREFPSG